MPPLAQHRGQRGVDPRDGPPVRHDDQRPPPRGQGRGNGPRQFLTPLRPGQGVPHRARCTSRGQRLQKRVPPLIPPPGAHRGRRGQRQRLGRRPLLGPSATRRDGKLQHIRQTPRIPVGDGPSEPQKLLAEHRLRRDDLSKRRQRPGVVRLGEPLDQKPVDQPPTLTPPFPDPPTPGTEPHPHPHPRLRIRVEFLGHGVVEVPVKMQHSLVDQYPRDRQLLGQCGPPPRPRLGPRHLGVPHTLPNQGKLLGLRSFGATVHGPVLAAHACILTKPH